VVRVGSALASCCASGWFRCAMQVLRLATGLAPGIPDAAWLKLRRPCGLDELSVSMRKLLDKAPQEPQVPRGGVGME
jgi:hypothetical protein